MSPSTKDSTSTRIQRLVFMGLGPFVVAASAQEQEHLVSQVREGMVRKDERYKDSPPMDIVFLKKKSYFSEKDLEAESLLEDRGGSADKVTPKKHLRDPKTDSQDNLEDPGVLQAYQVSGPAAGLPNGSGASFAEDEHNTLYFVVDRVNKAAQPPVSVDLVSPAAHPGKTSRRAKKRVLPKKEHVEVRKAKAENNSGSNEDDLPPGIVLGGNGIVWIDGSGTCVQGTSSFVKSKCDKLHLGCCDRDDSCEWPSDQTATVCKNSCTGKEACKNIGDGAVIEKGSCQGPGACSFLARDSTTGKIRVGKASCTSNSACRYICFQAEDCELTIGDNACTGGKEACRSIGNYKAQQIMIGDNSCEGNSACEYVALLTMKNVKIGSDSCVGNNACYAICYASETCELTIGDEACTDSNACGFLGTTPIGYYEVNARVEKIDVKYGACDGQDACEFFGAYSKSIKIGKEACQTDSACRLFGFYATQKVEAGDSSCDGYEACYDFARYIGDEDVKVNKNQCLGDMECKSPDCQNTAKVPNKDGLCPASP